MLRAAALRSELEKLAGSDPVAGSSEARFADGSSVIGTSIFRIGKARRVGHRRRGEATL